MCQTDLPKQYDVYPFIAPERFAGKLKDKVAVITGASSGIGRATALALAAAGAKVACVARRKPELDALVDEISSKHQTEALAIPIDITEPGAATTIVSQVEATLGPIDILINNAATHKFSRFLDIQDFDKDWYAMFDINLRAPISLIHAVLPSMVARKSGTLISLVSAAGVHNLTWQTAYSTSKCALTKFHQNLAWEIEPYNINSFAVHPGVIYTPLAANAGGEMMELVQSLPPEANTETIQTLNRQYEGVKFQSAEMAAQTLVALAGGEERSKVLSGRYVDGEQDMESVILEAEKEGMGRIGVKGLYLLKLEEL